MIMQNMKLDDKRIKELLRKEAKLNALEAGGVENWDWYGESLKEYSATIELEEDCENLVAEIFAEISGDIEEPAGRGCGYGIKEAGIEKSTKMLVNFVNERLSDNDK